MNYWLAKSEPGTYAWLQLVKERKTAWTGVRNYQARNNLRGMSKGDTVFFYHSGADKQVVGLARVTRTAYADPTAKDGDWSCVDLEADVALAKPVSLAAIKADSMLREMALVKNSRLSVTPVTGAQARRLLELAGMSRS